MAIKGRVGRHTQIREKQCQNWSDDQKAIIDLLNRIAPSNSGTGGSLKPRIVAGIASDELYNAIVAFEDKHFPRQRSGFVDPGGAMFRKLETLATASPAPVVPAVSKPPAPVVGTSPGPALSTDDRMLKHGEKALLRPVFKDTLPYDDQQIGANTEEWGGHTNSITPNYLPKLAMSIWRFDYSGASNSDKWIFVHEMAHAWQWYHGRNNVASAIKLALRYKNYEDAYDYNFDESANFFDFNFEQQASIVADYWYVTQSLVPQHNKGMRANLKTYEQYMLQVWNAGPPQRQPYRDRSKDWKMQRHTP